MSSADLDRRALELLREALELGPEGRQALIERRCQGDPCLRAEMGSLLAESSASGDDFLESPPIAAWAGGSDGTEPDALPERLGAYRVDGLLGEGGMGRVLLGVQEHPVRRRVALKVIRRIHGHRAGERFAVECQALAKLAHPNVAALYEVGETREGRPFVAMELVDGQGLIAYCDRHRLGLRSRIELFIQVCAAIRHAHEKGILHRDLKPSNVLVTEVDSRPLPKVIDFGIARIVDDPLLSSEAAIEDPSIVGSPAYMSPEAATGAAADTRSDVYSLGLLLYELVAGGLPFDIETQTVHLLRQRASRDQLPAPSERYGRLAARQRAKIAKSRGSSASRLERRLRGDLDAIIARAIAYEPAERYSSPADLAGDLERHLQHRPVDARPAAWTYLLGRTLRRRFGVATALAAVMLTLGLGIAASTNEARRANREAERAREFSAFLVELFALSDPDRDPRSAAGAQILLDRGAARLAENLQGQPLDRARLAHAISEIYLRLGIHDRAQSLAEEALAIRQAELATDDEERLVSLGHLGVVYRHQRRFEEAEPLLLELLDMRRRQADRRPLALADALNDLGNLEWSRDDNQAALGYYRGALEIRRRELPPHHVDLGRSLNNVAALAQKMGRYEQAAAYLQQADPIFVRALGEDHPLRAAGLNNLGMAQHRLGRWAEAESNLLRALAVWRRSHGETHQRTLNAKSNLARLMMTLGRWSDALEMVDDVIPALEAQPGRPHISLAANLVRRGLAQERLGQLEKAGEAFERAVDVFSSLKGQQERRTIKSKLRSARVAAKLGRPSEAIAACRLLLERIRERPEPDFNLEGFARRTLANMLIDLGRLDEAERHLLLALEADAREPDDRTANPEYSLQRLGDIAAQRGRPDEALDFYRRAAVLYRDYPPGHPFREEIEDKLEALSLPG